MVSSCIVIKDTNTHPKNITNFYKHLILRLVCQEKVSVWTTLVSKVFSHLKTECLYLESFTKAEEVQKVIKRYIHFYNNERIQVRLNNLSPVKYRAQVA
ncbi:hypothetical protein EGH10_12820 [Brevibacillus laterosporus]|uniref:Putative transposase OrfB n=1 Tax=Brevibacillus laterosporus LMG 15441 TaxID=1042163 RepID=A0A075R499_BRELA|nr:putative transposase OrfB [Brevibacillus laterosporus LMG 15441]RJL06476.1 hypothetical protein DM460_21985 [Brevibacillus laterosporus]TPH10568.1 hypothetical protein EGH10_12820 [Brevibacillus laterosporus]